MKATLSYTIPEERDEFELALRAGRYVAALEDFANEMRQIIKYGDEDAQATTWTAVREKFFQVLEHRGVEL
jgi:hypothetical protein